MASASRAHGSKQRVQDTAQQEPHDLPPSTLAAALINNLASSKPSRKSGQDDLQRLMSEVSSLENSINELNYDEKLEHQHKLIYVFARAVLERLNREDPFMNIDQLLSQASEALDVFMSTIKETPEVLNFALTSDSLLQSRGSEPLWIWLFPRILTLLCRQECDSLTEKIKDFFFISFQAVARSAKLWHLTTFFFSYLRECISTILSHLQGPGIMSRSKSIKIVLPYDDPDVNLFTQEIDSEVDHLLHCNYVLNNAGESLWHATNLLSMLVDISTAAANTYNATPAFQDYLVWIIDSLVSIYEQQGQWRAILILKATSKKSVVLSFCALHTLMSSLQSTLVDTITCKGYLFITVLCADILDNQEALLEKPTRLALCSSFLSLAVVTKQFDSINRAASLHLLPRLRSIIESEALHRDLGSDFKISCTILLQALYQVPKDTEQIFPSGSFEDVELNAEFYRLMLCVPQKHDIIVEAEVEDRPTKRRRVAVQNGLLEEITSKLYSLLGSQEVSDLTGLHQVVEACFNELDERDRCQSMELIGQLACASTGNLKVERTFDGTIRKATCTSCDSRHGKSNVEYADKTISMEAIFILTKLIKTPAFLDTRRPRVLAMIAVRKFAVHFNAPELIDLDISALGQWCLQSLQSSVRELRLASGRTLQAFLLHTVPDELSKRNRVNTFAILRSLSEKDTIYLQETCILAWGQVGRISKDEELNIVLLKLVEYLGHSNTIISGAAYCEILGLAKRNGISTERMFGAFWDNIAIAAVKDLLVRPNTSQLMADLLEMSVPEFLVRTQAYTLPYLVLTRNSGVIKRISQARKDDEVWQACWDPPNLTRILALLLVQAVTDTESFILSLLRSISPWFKDFDLTGLLRNEPASTALHLLRAAGDADDSKKSRIRAALQLLASRAPLPSDGHQNKKNTLGLFLEHHILGIVARFSDVINDSRVERPMSEKLSCVRALDEMVKVGKGYTRTARPQICACLQSAMAQVELQNAAFSAWQTMLMNLDDDDVEGMLESTFATIIQRWDTFDETCRLCARETLQYLIRNRKKLVQRMIPTLPSLAQLPMLADMQKLFEKLRGSSDTIQEFSIFSRRLGHENSGVVSQTLVELKQYLQQNQSFLQASAVSEQPHVVVGQLVRAIIDACVKFNESHDDVSRLAAECLGLVGCLDANRVEAVREQREKVVVSNFHDSDETTDFVLFLLEEVMVKAFLSATDTILQGFLSFVMQDLLEKCDFRSVFANMARHSQIDQAESEIYKKWTLLPTNVQQTLTPFLTSKYSVREMKPAEISYPIFSPDTARTDKLYNSWLKSFVLDLLQKPLNGNADIIFAPLRRAVRIKDISVASFLLPYVVLHVVAEGREEQRKEVGRELLRVLEYQIPVDSHIKREEVKLCSEAVFRTLDYLSRWIQEKQASPSGRRGQPSENIKRVASVLEMIPAEVIAGRAVECKSYSRALFHWEQHIRNHRKNVTDPDQSTILLERLQDIYTQIDEPDGIEGISAHLHVLDIDQQILGHRKAGRWAAAQSWYEIKLADSPDNTDLQVNLLTCLKESGQHDVLLNYVEGMHTTTQSVARILPFATEAAWSTGKWASLEKYTKMVPNATGDDFNIGIGSALLTLYGNNSDEFASAINFMRGKFARSLSNSTTTSLSSCHDTMLKFHVLTELEMIASTTPAERPQVLASLDRRLEVIGAYLNDKQYLLGIRRAAMQLSSSSFTTGDVASAWLTSARLARKGNAINQSFNAVLHASQLGDESATIEHARLLWKEGHPRKAIQSLQGAIDSNAFISHNKNIDVMTSVIGVEQTNEQNLLTARAHLLLAKWLDSAGQTHSLALRAQYQTAAKTHHNWEKGHYYLGRHYNKLLQSEKALPPESQAESYLRGETARLVIENYLRALSFGTKYIYQTLPRILTLWLDLGAQVNQPLDSKYGSSKEFVTRVTNGRKESLTSIHNRFTKYVVKMPAYMFYTALPQIMSRINHANTEVFKYLTQMIVKTVSTYPQHALWGLLAVATSMQADRKARGGIVIAALRGNAKKLDSGGNDIKMLLKAGESVAQQLIVVCNAGEFHGNRTSWASLTRDLGFNHKVTPSPLAMPVENVLTATLPTLTGDVRSHKAFSRDIVTITSFEDEVMILSSLQKPRKLTARGSDGKKYGLMCKPKDDLRKDQRLMEFNSMINRSLKRDAESSRRQLYIKTYAVTPLNEECGIIEWVDGLKTLRDLLLTLYKPVGISPNYREIEMLCDEASKDEKKMALFSEKVLGQFPPIFHQWFVQQFPEPPAWFAARLRYTRSCAVMSMIGTILGLGDRHGENILFEEGNGGTFHVDFNCLFDKGLTFVKPERVPFRLTHNMVDAMGIYGYEGPFRKSSELTLKLLRQHEETLMTILEAFVYDPTLDLLTKKPEKKKKEGAFNVPTTPQGVLDTINRKVKGLLTGESVPLGVEGQVDELIKQATSLQHLAGMYIGWCAFF